MARTTPTDRGARLVWRMTDSAPMGEFVNPADLKRDPHAKDQPEVTLGGGWIASSFDLLHGTDVTDYPDTVTPAQFDALFGKADEWPDTQAPDGT